MLEFKTHYLIILNFIENCALRGMNKALKICSDRHVNSIFANDDKLHQL